MRLGGRTDHVVVVGAGLAGLSAALHLAGRGRAVTVVERGDVSGWPGRRMDIDGYRLDTGPTVLTMPDMIDETFAAVGESTADRLELDAVDPAYRASSPTAARSMCTATATRWPPRSTRFAGPRAGAGLPAAARLADAAVPGRVRRLHRLELRLSAVVVDSAARPADRARRLPALGPGGEAVHHRSSGCTGSSPSRRSMRGFRPSGRSRSTPSSPTWTPSRACTSRAAACGRCPTRWPPPRLMPVSNSATAQRYRDWSGATDRIRRRVTPTAASASTPTQSYSPPSCLTPIGCWAAPRAGCCRCGRRRRRSSPTSAADRVDREMPHHHIFSATRGSRRSATSSTTGVVMRDPSLLVTRPTAGDPDAGAGGSRPALHPGARAEHRSGARSTGSPSAARYTDSMMDAVTDRLPAARRRRRTAARRQPRGLGAAGHGGGHTVRARAHLRPDGTVPAGQHRSRHRQRRAGRLLDGARRRRADRPDVGAAGRRPDHRRRPGAAITLTGGAEHDPLRTGRRRCARPGPARRLPALPGAQRASTAARSFSPPGCSRPSSVPRYTRCTGSPAVPTTFSTTSTRHSCTAERADRLQRLATQLFNQLVKQVNQPVTIPRWRAVVHTARRLRHRVGAVRRLPASMRMDLTVTDYPDRAALNRYMHGSAEVIGLQMLPVLGTVGPREEAAPYAAALGKAFQLTNFLRDVDEDLQRGRIYLPADELAAHRVDRDLLMWCHTNMAHRRPGTPRAGRTTRRHPSDLRIRPHRASNCSHPGPGPALRRRYAVLGDPGPHREHRLRDLQPARHRRHRRRLQVAGRRAAAGLARTS